MVTPGEIVSLICINFTSSAKSYAKQNITESSLIAESKQVIYFRQCHAAVVFCLLASKSHNGIHGNAESVSVASHEGFDPALPIHNSPSLRNKNTSTRKWIEDENVFQPISKNKFRERLKRAPPYVALRALFPSTFTLYQQFAHVLRYTAFSIRQRGEVERGCGPNRPHKLICASESTDLIRSVATVEQQFRDPFKFPPFEFSTYVAFKENVLDSFGF